MFGATRELIIGNHLLWAGKPTGTLYRRSALNAIYICKQTLKKASLKAKNSLFAFYRCYQSSTCRIIGMLLGYAYKAIGCFTS